MVDMESYIAAVLGLAEKLRELADSIVCDCTMELGNATYRCERERGHKGAHSALKGTQVWLTTEWTGLKTDRCVVTVGRVVDET